MTIYRGYAVGDDEETAGKKDGVDAILSDENAQPCYNPNPCPRKTLKGTCDPYYFKRFPTSCGYLKPTGHSCTQPLNRKCWDCGFCIDRPGCGEPVDGYGNPIL